MASTNSGRDAGERSVIGFNEDRPSGAHPVARRQDGSRHDSGTDWSGARELSSLPHVSEVTRQMLAEVWAIAIDNPNLLLRGPKGVGKKHIARMLHNTTTVASSTPYLVVSTNEELARALSGYESLEQAPVSGEWGRTWRRTLVVVEVQCLAMSAQGALHEAMVQNDALKRSGAASVDRIVVTTSSDIETAVQKGELSASLYQSLRDVMVSVPPLSERKADIASLAQLFLACAREREAHASATTFAPSAMAWLEAREWQGNIEELRGVVERAVTRATGEQIGVQELERAAGNGNTSTVPSGELPLAGIDLRHVVEQFENHLILQALERTRWNKNQAAKLLGLNRTTLVEMLKRKGIRAA